MFSNSICHCPSKLWRCAFWMKHWGHSNFKRTKLWSISFAVWRFNVGRLDTKKQKNEKTTVRKYISKSSGKAGYTGTKDLKQTQSFGCENKIIFCSDVDFWNGCQSGFVSHLPSLAQGISSSVLRQDLGFESCTPEGQAKAETSILLHQG